MAERSARGRSGAAAVAVMLIAVAAACTPVGDASTDDSTATTELPANPGTLFPPTTEPPVVVPVLLPIGHVVAFLDACIDDDDLVGPCHCAARRLQAGFDADDIEVFEDRMSGGLEYPPQVAAALVDCREDVAVPRWSTATRESYVEACAKGSELLVEPCTCSLTRAEEVIPADRLDEYAETPAVRPDFADLVNLCL
ncbi:MAG TPA: hypothetical protein DEP66_03085 [Acidimicrobiaceae bacterium]|nr:hypothetical protein [Acidimicrobiaceae bacterium]HCB37202.1 hypothetical protein [Acidimicrobiaceae bacterium]